MEFSVVEDHSFDGVCRPAERHLYLVDGLLHITGEIDGRHAGGGQRHRQAGRQRITCCTQSPRGLVQPFVQMVQPDLVDAL